MLSAMLTASAHVVDSAAKEFVEKWWTGWAYGLAALACFKCKELLKAFEGPTEDITHAPLNINPVSWCGMSTYFEPSNGTCLCQQSVFVAATLVACPYLSWWIPGSWVCEAMLRKCKAQLAERSSNTSTTCACDNADVRWCCASWTPYAHVLKPMCKNKTRKVQTWTQTKSKRVKTSLHCCVYPLSFWSESSLNMGGVLEGVSKIHFPSNQLSPSLHLSFPIT